MSVADQRDCLNSTASRLYCVDQINCILIPKFSGHSYILNHERRRLVPPMTLTLNITITEPKAIHSLHLQRRKLLITKIIAVVHIIVDIVKARFGTSIFVQWTSICWICLKICVCNEISWSLVAYPITIGVEDME